MAAPSRSLSRADVLSAIRGFSSPPAWLAAGDDGERIGAALASTVPQLRSGELTLESCSPKHLRLKDDASWEGSYRLIVRTGEGERRELRLAGELRPPRPDETAAASGRLGDDDWACALPALGLALRTQQEDAELPALGLLTDPERSRKLLEDAISARGGRYTGLRIARCTPRIARHNPGSRCAVVYTLEYAPEDAARGWPELVVAKTYRGDKGAVAYASMSALWDTPLARGDVVTLAEPLAYLASDRILVQGPIAEEQTLKALLPQALADPADAGALETALRMSAAGLAAMHACGVDYGEELTLGDRLEEAGKLAGRFASPLPAVYAAAAAVLDLVAERAAAIPPDASVPSHRSFRPAQVLLAGGRIGFIDFDGFCRSEPSLDVALFRATTKSIGLEALGPDAGEAARRARLAHIDELCARFTDAYADLAPLNRDRMALWETLDLLTNVLNPWAKIKLERLPSTTFALRAHLESLLR